MGVTRSDASATLEFREKEWVYPTLVEIGQFCILRRIIYIRVILCRSGSLGLIYVSSLCYVLAGSRVA